MRNWLAVDSTAAMVCDPIVVSTTFERKVYRISVGVVGGSMNLAAGLDLAYLHPRFARAPALKRGFYRLPYTHGCATCAPD